MKGEIAAAAFILLTFGAEAVELCVSPSKTFQGPCVDNADCAAACHTEGFLSGYCHIVRSRGCRCSTYCEGGGDGGGVDGEGDDQAPSPDDDPSDDGPTAASAARLGEPEAMHDEASTLVVSQRDSLVDGESTMS